MVKPIPKAVLIHSAQYEEYAGNDRHGESYKDPITLYNVRIEEISNIVRSNMSEETLFDALLFYDVVNSSAEAAFTFKEKSKVTFDGKTMLVKKINKAAAFKLHHYEVELV